MIRYHGYTITFPCRYLHWNGRLGVITAKVTRKNWSVVVVPTHQTKWAALRQAVSIINETGRGVTCHLRKS